MPIISYAQPGTQLYVSVDNAGAFVFNMTPGTGKKARRFYVPDSTMAKAKLPAGHYTAEIREGTSQTASDGDPSRGVVDFMFDGTSETNWSMLVIKALQICNPSQTAAIQALIAPWIK